MSLSTGFSPKPLGMIFSRRRSSTNSRKIRRPDEAPMHDRQSQVRDALLEIVLETGERARQEIDVVGADAGRQLPGDRTRGHLIAGGDPRLDLRPQIGRDLGCEVAHPVRKATWRAERGKHSSIARMIPGTDAALPEQFSPTVTFDAMVMFHDNGHHGGRLGQGVILAKVVVFGRASHAAHTGEDRQAFVATSATFCKIDAQLCGRTCCRICGSPPTESLERGRNDQHCRILLFAGFEATSRVLLMVGRSAETSGSAGKAHGVGGARAAGGRGIHPLSKTGCGWSRSRSTSTTMLFVPGACCCSSIGPIVTSASF
jgi:hypothetical protein